MTDHHESEPTTVALPVSSSALPEGKRKQRRPRLTKEGIRRARVGLEALVAAGKLGARSPAMRRIRQIEAGWRKQLGVVNAGIESALRVAAGQQLLLERIDAFVLQELPSPANKGKRALHNVAAQRQAIADRLFDMLQDLGLLRQPETNGSMVSVFVESMREAAARDLEDGYQRGARPPAPPPPAPAPLQLAAPEPSAPRETTANLPVTPPARDVSPRRRFDPNEHLDPNAEFNRWYSRLGTNPRFTKE